MNNASTKMTPIDEGRKQARTHLFVAATLCSDLASAPARIRNMSSCGALIESAAIPESGTAVMLKRGSLQIEGRVVWKADRKAGIAFLGDVHVAEWMSRKVEPHQERVDEIVWDFKSDRRLRSCANEVAATGSSSAKRELLELRTELIQLGNSLIGDVVLIATHPEIQMLDIAVQRVDRLLGQLRST